MINETIGAATRDNDKPGCPCARPGHKRITTLDPAEFSPEDFCLDHLDVDLVRANDKKLTTRPFQSLPEGEFTVELGIAIAACKPFLRKRSAESFRTNATRLLRYHAGEDIRYVKPDSFEDDFDVIRAEVAERKQASGDHRCGVGDGAVESYVATLRRIYKRLESFMGGLYSNPAASLEKPNRRHKGQREVYTASQLRHIWAAAKLGSDARLYLLILTIIRITAARRMTVIGLNLEDIDWCTGKTILRGKGGVVYESYLSHAVMNNLLKLYIERASITTAQFPTLFAHLAREGYDPDTGEGGTPALLRSRSGLRINNRTFEKLSQTIRTNVPADEFRRPFIAHSLRHTTLTQVLMCFDEAAAAGMAGHRSNKAKTSLAEATRDYVMARDDVKAEMFNMLFGPDHITGPVRFEPLAA